MRGAIAGLVMALALGGCSPLVTWRSIAIDEADVLLEPVRVTRVEDERKLHLADGRIVLFAFRVPQLSERVEGSGGEVEVQADDLSGDPASIRVIARTEGVRPACGNPYMGLLRIPLHVDVFPKYAVELLGSARIVKP